MWVWFLVCDIEERQYTGSDNSADQILDFYAWN